MKKIKLSISCALLCANLYGAQELEEIKVYSALKSHQSIQDVTSNIEIITAKELEQKHITTLIDALQYANISINQSGGPGQTSSFFLQGMSAEHTLVLIDGVRFNDPTVTNGYALLEHITVANIKQIEIIKGAQSGVWGADAAAGVINIITKDTAKHLVSINTELGSFNTKKYNLLLQGNNKYHNFALSYGKLTTDGFSAIAPEQKDLDKYEDDKYENATLNLKYGLKLGDNNKLNLSHTAIDTSGDYDNSFAVGTPADDKDANFESENKSSSVNFTHNNNFTSIDIYFNESTFDRTFNSVSAFGPSVGEYVGRIQEIGIKTNTPYNENDFIIIGADKKEQSIDKSYSALEGAYKSKAGFVTNSNSFNNLIVTQSLRYDSYDKFKNTTTGKLGLAYFVSNDLNLKANYGTASKAPSLYNLYAGFGAGDPTLDSEDIKSFDTSLNYKDFSVKYYKSTIKNEILYSNTTFGYYQNKDTSKYSGVELNYKKTLETTRFGFKYLTQKAKDSNNKDLPRREKNKATFDVDYFGFKKYNFNLNATYIGSRYDDVAKTKQTGKYTLVNSVINYTHNKNLGFYGKIDNLTNKEYQVVDGYGTSPRAYYVGLNAKF